MIQLLLKEIVYRKANFGLSLLAVCAAATLFVVGPTLIDGYGQETEAGMRNMEDETRKLMRDMGFNLMIVHRDTDMRDFWSSDFATVDMPEEYVQRLANARSLTLVTHLVATLQNKIEWNRRKVLLVGYLPEVTQHHLGEKSPMGYDIEPGTVYLGHELGVGQAVGSSIEVLGETFRIARLLPEQGSKKDITIAMHLADAQRILGKAGKVNQILALGCRCAGERLPQIRNQLARVLPETKITEFRSMAVARAEQRDLVRKERMAVAGKIEALVSIFTPLVIAACAIWVGLMALGNVRERRTEIGLFRALGVGSGKIGAIFLGKAALVGVLGGAVGLAVGSWLAGVLGTQVLDVASSRLSLRDGMIVYTLLGAPLLSAMASYLPTLTAIVQDPAVILREE